MVEGGRGGFVLPVLLMRVHSQTHDLAGLQSPVGAGVLVTLVVAEGAVVQRAPAAAELCRNRQRRGFRHKASTHCGV